LNAGTLVVGHNTALGSGALTVNGGILAAAGGFRQLGNSLIVGGDFQIGNGNGQSWGWVGPVNLGGAIRTITTSNFWQIDGVISSGGLIAASPNGSQLELRAANTYAGGTTVSGFLTVNNTSGSGTGSGTVTVQTNGILAGTGTIGGAVTFEAGSFARLGTSGVLKLNSSLIISGSAKVQLAMSNNVPIGSYTLATYNTSGSSGAFNSSPLISSGSFAPGTQGAITTSGGNVVLQVTASVPPTIQSPYLNGGQLVLRINTDLGSQYVLQSTTNLGSAPIIWMPVSTNAGTGGPITNTVPVTSTPPNQFFRYQVQ
jgi:hypothetical protein